MTGKTNFYFSGLSSKSSKRKSLLETAHNVKGFKRQPSDFAESLVLNWALIASWLVKTLSETVFVLLQEYISKFLYSFVQFVHIRGLM